MLDLGFLPAIRRIAKALPEQRQSLFFSATMPADVKRLADGLLRQPMDISVEQASPALDRIDQQVIGAEAKQKGDVLVDLLRGGSGDLTLVFTRTKRGADRLVRRLGTASIKAEALHGNKSQNQRQRTLSGFREGRTRVLVATDLAARGIDIDGIGLVVNYDLPNVAETYVHRIGRTARAGATGRAVSLCSRDERPHLIAIEKLIKCRIPVLAHAASDSPAGAEDETPPAVAPRQPRNTGQRKAPAGPAKRTGPRRQRRNRQASAPERAAEEPRRAAEEPRRAAEEPRRVSDAPRSARPAQASKPTDDNGHPLEGMAFLRRRPTEVADRPAPQPRAKRRGRRTDRQEALAS